MKNKKATYLLILLTIVIWGTIGWKVYRTLREDNIPITASSSKHIPKQVNNVPSLLLNYRDPFLGDYSEPLREEHVNTKPQSVMAKQPVIEEPEIFSDFQYKGIIKIGSEVQAMVYLDGETILCKVNDQVGEFVISNIFDDKLIVRRNKKERTLPLQ